MKIEYDKKQRIKISNFTGKIWITNKLNNEWMYGTLPEKIFPVFENDIARFTIPIKRRKYGDVWQINGLENLNTIDVGDNIEIINKHPVQFAINRNDDIKTISVTKLQENLFQLSRYLKKDELIFAKRRINSNYGNAYFPEEYVFHSEIQDKEMFINIPQLVKKLKIVEGDIIDFFIKNSGHEEKLLVKGLSGDWYSDKDDHSKYRIYQTGAKTLAVYFYTEKSLYVKKIIWQDSKLIITLPEDVSPKDISNLELIESTRTSAASSIRVLVPLHSYVEEQNIVIDDDFLFSELSRRNKIGFRLFFSYKNSRVKNQFRTDDSEIFEADNDYSLINISVHNFLALELKKKKSSNTVKVAVLGSSHTRPMFRSDSYFNPDYKNFYEVVYTQFHSSIISLVGRARKFQNQYYATRKQTVKNYIKTDFEKTFFEELKQASPDFLIIDIYIDVQMGVIYFGDGSIISYNSYQAESNYVLDNLNDKPKLSTIFNDDNYVDDFKRALKKFKEMLLEIIPENKIIIHSFDMSEDYKDNEKNIKNYKQSKGSIVELNEIAVEMQFLLERTFPKANILDIRDSNYHGGINNPIGNMPHHFESDYYKELLNKLTKIILTIER